MVLDTVGVSIVGLVRTTHFTSKLQLILYKALPSYKKPIRAIGKALPSTMYVSDKINSDLIRIILTLLTRSGLLWFDAWNECLGSHNASEVGLADSIHWILYFMLRL